MKKNILVVLGYPLQEQIDIGHLDILETMFKAQLQIFNEVHIYSPRDNREYYLGKNIFVHTSKNKNLPRLLSMLLDVYYAYLLTKKYNISVVRAMAPHTSGVIAYFIKKLTGVPYICSAHMDRKTVEKIENSKYRMLGWLLDLLERKVYENSVVIPVISHHVKKYVLSIAPRVGSKIVMHRNFVDTELFKPKKTNKKNTFIFVGRLEKSKGAEYLIKAAKILANKGHKFKIMICGDGTERRSLEYLVKNERLQKMVKFKGYVKHSELPIYLNRSLALVVPLLGGFTIIEGMSCGLPIVAADIEWSSEIIKNNVNGFIVPAKDPTALANAMERIIKNKKLVRKIGKINRKIAIQEFSKRAWIEREIGLYKLMTTNP